MAEKLDTKRIIGRFKAKHGNKYDYTEVEYHKYEIPVVIRCPIHGRFEQTPKSHLSGTGCPQCGKTIQNEAAAITLAKKKPVVSARALALSSIFPR
ncbi:hypothetical protein JXVLWARM_CDS_0004 [Burkholderia phage Bm1]